MSRAYTEDEVIEQFLRHIWMIIEYWKRQNEDCNRKLEGLAHSILTSLDGCSMGLLEFKIIPMTSQEDKEYHIENGENYYPEDIDIAGCLNDLLFKYKPDERKI